ncbi:MAG: putative hydro-lyase [Lachnospiraceae bacterium]|nr:putative hydro-lyase [Lachnospiraceae bacterium]
MDLKHALPADVRKMIREGKITTPTSGMCAGYAQANLAILPKELAYDFLLFTQRNPKPCPILEVSDAGSRYLKYIAKDCDIATDFPKYRIYEKGVMTGEYTSVEQFWKDDLVSFLIGCSFSFESELIDAGIEIRHNTEGCNVPMYITNIETVPAGIFHGPMTVSMRPIPYDQVVRAVQVSGTMPRVHGAPIHIGDPSVIGIKDINKPDFGDPVTIKPGEVPVFWPCGVTPQSVLMNVKPDFVITHAPGHMLITDVKNSELKNA